MPTTLATNPDDVHVGIEFEFGVVNQGRQNMAHDLQRTQQALFDTGCWVQVPEHTGAEANLVGSVPLSRYVEVHETLFDALDSTGLTIVTDHCTLCGNHVHINVENNRGPGLHFPTLFDAYTLGGWQQRMWSLITVDHRRVNPDTQYNHQARRHETFAEALASRPAFCDPVSGAHLGPVEVRERHADGMTILVRWAQLRGHDFSPRDRLGSVELRTWDAVKNLDVIGDRYQYLHDLFAHVIDSTPDDAGPTDYLTANTAGQTGDELLRRGQIASPEIITAFLNTQLINR